MTKGQDCIRDFWLVDSSLLSYRNDAQVQATATNDDTRLDRGSGEALSDFRIHRCHSGRCNPIILERNDESVLVTRDCQTFRFWDNHDHDVDNHYHGGVVGVRYRSHHDGCFST